MVRPRSIRRAMATAGTYYGNPSFGQPGAINNDPDTAVGFNGPGSGDYVEVPDPDSQSFSQPTSGAGLTVEVWMRPDALVFPGETWQPVRSLAR